jgi:hypothetical protein
MLRAKQGAVVHAGKVFVEVRTGGVIPTVDRMGMVGHEPYSRTDSTQRVMSDITAVMFSRTRGTPPACFIPPCLPPRAERPPSGPGWVHEIKHDGFRLMARRDAAGVRLLTRNGHDWADRYPLIADAAGRARGALVPDRWRGSRLR